MLTNSAFLSRFRHQIRDSVFALQTFNVLRFSAFFLVSVLLVKIPLPVEQIADYEYVLFLSSIVTGWWIHGFLQSYMSDSGSLTINGKKLLFRGYSRLFVILGSGILLVVGVAIEILASFHYLQKPPERFYYFLFFHFVLQGCILIVYYFHQRKLLRPIYFLAIYFFVTYIASFILLLRPDASLPQVYAWLAGFSLPILGIWIYLYVKSGTTTDQKSIKSYLSQLSILMLIQGIGFISLWSDGFWVQYFYGTDKMFALFRYGGREFPLFIILTTTFGTAIIHEAATEKGWRTIHDASRRFIGMFLPVAFVLLFTSQYLFAWIYHTDFVPASFIFDLYLLLIVVRVLFPRTILIAHRYYKSLFWITIAELLVNAILSVTLYWIWGILGLILGSVFAHIFELGVSMYIIRSRLGIQLKKIMPVRIYLAFVVVLVLVVVVKYCIFGEEWLSIMIKP